PAAIAIPHGRREESARSTTLGALEKLGDAAPMLVPVDETASVVWATSATAKRRLASSDTGMRATLRLARRLRDPLHELLRVEPRGLGLGHNLTEVHQGLLNRQLETVIASTLGRVGVDLNRADQGLLARLPGVSRELAKAIVQHRSEHGPFPTITALRGVEGVDEADWVYTAGFLRIHGGEEPLDATPIHPEDYDFVRELAAQAGKTTAELLGTAVAARAQDLTTEDRGPRRVRDILHWIEL